METTLATILITATATVAVIGLGVIVWAIAQLKRKVSRLEVLCSGYESQINSVFNEFDSQNRNHGDSLKNVKNDIQMQLQDVWRKFDEQHDHLGRQIEWLSRKDDEIHQRIDSSNDEFERALDKRFDSVYRKLYNSKTINEPTQGSNIY